MIDIDKVVERMGNFAATTKDDKLSVMVSRLASRLAHMQDMNSRQLSSADLAIIRPFLKVR